MVEFATTKFFNEFLNNNWNAHSPLVTTTHDQIDISLNYKELNYKVEVRSSFIQNSITFALYMLHNSRTYKGKTYFDVLGTYRQ